MDKHPLLDLLATHACPELAAALRKRKPHILRRWEERVCQTIPKAEGLTKPQLRDDAPGVLEQIARTVESTRRKEGVDLKDKGPDHGKVRFDQQFRIDELLIEYALLRATLFEEVLNELNRPPEPSESVALNAALDVAIRESVTAFADHQARALKSATEAQSKYLSFLSHDLRGGLNGMFLMIEVLKRELATEPRFADTVEDLDVMRRSLMDTVATMDRFLHAERFRKGKVQLRPVKLQMRALLSEVVAHFSYQAKDKGLELRMEASADCAVTSDREMLLLIVQNLVSNAVKYTGNGTVSVSGGPSDNGGGCLISVHDQGPGIDSGRLDDLFSAFIRGDTHGQPGVGLGLSIARQAAEFIGAKLWAESRAGGGSTFHVLLPSNLPPPAVTAPS